MNSFCFKGKKLSLGEKTYIMGILNITPDSFSDGGAHFSKEDAVKAAVDMEKAGADIIDIGGQSTRPGFKQISKEEEWARLCDILPLVVSSVGVPVSVDTFYPYVADKALQNGASIVNCVKEITPEMAAVVCKYNAGIILMHPGEIENKIDPAASVHATLVDMLNRAVALGIPPENICLDPGIGFDKTNAQCVALIKECDRIKVKGFAFLVGLSRKRVVGELAGRDLPFMERDIETAAANLICIMKGADIIRVHNCEICARTAAVADKLLREKKG